MTFGLISNTASSGNLGSILSTSTPTTPSYSFPLKGQMSQLTQAAQSLSTTEVMLQGGQPSNPVDSGGNVDMHNQTTYREGGASEDGVVIPYPRALGEEEDSVATISVSTDPAGSGGEGDVLNAYSRFFLESINEAQAEKYQVVETFTSWYAFFYGKRPSVYSFRGTLLNDVNHRWTNDMMFFYENYMRGTRTAELGAQAILHYDQRLVTGFIVNLQIQQTAIMNKGAAFGIDVLVTDHVPTRFSADIDDLVARARQGLQTRADRIAQQLSMVNKSVPSGPKLAAAGAVTGQQPFSAITDLNNAPIPVSFKKFM